jgi:hypothetical protein
MTCPLVPPPLLGAHVSGRVVDFHALRHTFITRLARSGVVPAVAKSLARHSTIVLTMDHYTPTLIGDERAALDRLPNIDVYTLREAEAKAAIEAAAQTAANPATAPAYKPPASLPSEPAVKIEQSAAGAGGKRSLKLTFAGGRMPTISAPPPLDDWRPYNGFAADVAADRTCVLVFRAMAQTSKYGTGYNEGVSR